MAFGCPYARDLHDLSEDCSVPDVYRFQHYRGYDITAVREVCDILYIGKMIDHFSREYLRSRIPPGLVLAMLINEAQERIDALIEVGTRRRRAP